MKPKKIFLLIEGKKWEFKSAPLLKKKKRAVRPVLASLARQKERAVESL